MVNKPYKFLQGGGEMGELIRNFDWSKTSIGSPETWPQSLRLSASIMLSTPFPMYIAWGKEYIQLYNDGYRPILGSSKHPRAIGISTRETFAEIWHIIGSMFNGVMEGTAIGFPDFMLPLDRNGYVEECYFDFSYSPIRDEYGEVGGVLVTVVETTQNYKNLARLKASEATFRILMQEAPVAICNLLGRDLIIESVNDRMLAFFGKKNEIIGKPYSIAVPELVGQPFFQILDECFTSGNIYYGNESKAILERNGQLEEGYFNFIYKPFRNTNGEVANIMIVAIEVTELVLRRQREQELNEELTVINEELVSSNEELKHSEYQLQQSLNQLQESENKFRLLADNISQLAWMTDETGYIFWYNQRWYDYTGTTFEEMQGWNWQKVHHPEHVDRVVEKFSENIKSSEIWEDIFPIRSKEGTYRWFLSRAIPVKNEEGKVLRWFGTNTDITEQRLLEQQKDDFISIASHELKTPITSLQASIQLLEKMKGNPSATLLPRLIEQSGKSMQKISVLVDGLLNVSRINEGHLRLNKREFVVYAMLNDCCNAIRLGKKYSLSIQGDEKITVVADEHQIDQVVTNFLNNAIKYASNSNEILLRIENDESHLKVLVTDSGPGIEADMLPKLFERYFRANHSGFQNSGLGLGLYISSEIIKRHGGKIGVESELGKGTTFWFTLPLKDNSLAS